MFSAPLEIFQGTTPVRDLHMVFNLPYVYYKKKLCRRQSEVIQNQVNEHLHCTGQGEARYIKCKRLKLDSGQAYDRSSD
jgi:hypothetical protein